MSFERHFCPSPWFHMRINNTGHYEYCRWATKGDRTAGPSIRDQSPIQWFQQDLAGLRRDLLAGRPVPGCQDCRIMEQHGKISGRQRQLLKIGVDLTQFAKSLLSSPWAPVFEHSQNLDGTTTQAPQDWQIDLGNYCNSACVFCTPFSSSRLESEFRSLALIPGPLPRPWCDDPDLVEQFLDNLTQTPHLQYLHFIGGETLITPAFSRILDRLIQRGLNRSVTLGFTTNLTTWSEPVVDLVSQFDSVNLGMSIECVSSLNDYVRYGSEIGQVLDHIGRWTSLARQQGWLMQLRPTPNVLTIGQLESVYELAWHQGLSVESCNFITNPVFMKPSVLPIELRLPIMAQLESWIQSKGVADSEPVINVRDPNHHAAQILQDARSYVNYLRDQPDESHRLADLVTYIKILERSRGNRILDHLPHYENLLRSAGY